MYDSERVGESRGPEMRGSEPSALAHHTTGLFNLNIYLPGDLGDSFPGLRRPGRPHSSPSVAAQHTRARVFGVPRPHAVFVPCLGFLVAACRLQMVALRVCAYPVVTAP